jgi:CYTH domain-containing protein
MVQVADRLRSFGFRVYGVPEAATLLIGGGADPRSMAAGLLVHFQATLLSLAMSLEDAFLDLAREASGPAVLLCDRGAMDSAAYMSPGAWQALLDERGWSVVGLRDRRYDAVVHLATAAVGAEAFYTLANNAARSESLEEARVLDARLREAWVGHPHLRVVDNSTDFAGKVQRAVAAVCGAVGVPEPVEIERKFLVRGRPDDGALDRLVHSEVVEIEQTYLLVAAGSEARVRRRGQRGAYTYTHTVKRPLAAGQRVEQERPITGREYVALLAQADPSRRTIRKRRRCFLWENQYFELDEFIEPHAGLRILEAELDDAAQTLALPPFLEIEREVTNEPEYANAALARIQVS